MKQLSLRLLLLVAVIAGFYLVTEERPESLPKVQTAQQSIQTVSSR
jgi:hypothetical protein